MYPASEPTKEDLLGLHTGTNIKWTTSAQIQLKDRMTSRQGPPRRLAYLDGIRGFAAVLVYILHHELFSHTLAENIYMESGWGFHGQYHFATLPFIRIFFVGGHYGVTTFLVMSGYVLSHAPLRCIHAKNTAKLHDTVSSALLRRFPRLWIPVTITTFLYISSWHFFDIRAVAPEPEKNFSAELVGWFHDIRTTSFLYNPIYLTKYNYHLWTIPVEFRGSIVVYTTLIALQKVPKNKRLLCQVAMIWYFTYIIDGWYCALFISGMLLCDLDLLADQDELPPVLRYFQRVQTWIFPLLMVIILYLGGVPCVHKDIDYLRANPGWYWLSYTIPRAMEDYRWWFRGWASILTVVAIPRIRVLRTFFESAICQYLGKVSFAFYLIHGPVLFTVGDRLYAATGRNVGQSAELVPHWINWAPLPSWGLMGMEFNYIAPHLILFPLTIWLADLTTRLVDEPTIKFCRWLSYWLSEEDSSDTRAKTEQYV